MGKIKMFLAIIAFVLLGIWTTFAINSSSYSSDWWYNTPIIDWSIKFEAKLDGSKVYTKWSKYNKDEKFKYYKVVRSSTVSSPVYPDNGYIKYEWDLNKTEFVDYKPLVGTSYYRVCAITYENNRYCSNVVKIYKKSNATSWEVWVCTMEYAPVCWKTSAWEYKTFSNKCMLENSKAIYKYKWECKSDSEPVSWTICPADVKKCPNWLYVSRTWPKCEFICTDSSGLSYKLKLQTDRIVIKFIDIIESKFKTDDQRIEAIEKVIPKLEDLKERKPKLKAVIDYIVTKLKQQAEKYDDDFSEIEDLLLK